MSFADMALTPQTDPRRAALLLHAMAPADREWLLERMPASAGQVLRELLAELSELGIPPDASVLDSVLQVPARLPAPVAPMPQAVPVSGVSSDADFLMALDIRDVGALVQAWHGQPARLVASALCLRPWPWRPLALEKLPQLQRRRVMDLMESMSLNAVGDNAMAKALMAAMRCCCEQARQVAAGVPAPVPPARGKGIPRWLRRGP